MIGLGDLPGGNFASSANGLSDDGTIVSGGGEVLGGWTEVYRWTPADGMTGLGLPPGLPALTAAGMSADGAVIAAHWGEPFYWTQSSGWTSASASGYKAYRWIEAGGLVVPRVGVLSQFQYTTRNIPCDFGKILAQLGPNQSIGL